MISVARIRDSFAAHLNLGETARKITGMKRELDSVSRTLGNNADNTPVDTTTPRLPILNKLGTEPIIRPSGNSWMSGAVYDGRPIEFEGKKFVYFCGQPSYRTDQYLFVGLAEWLDGKIIVDPTPVLWPDSETRGIDIPAFTVWGDRVIAAYMDDYGPARTGRGYDTSFIVAESSDGRAFNKKRIKHPFGNEWSRIGLPWLLADNDHLLVYWRGKKGKKNLIVRTELSATLDGFVGDVHSVEIPRTSINVAVMKRNDSYFLFSGNTLAGGLYVTKSRDGINWDFSREAMIVGNTGHEWGWDFTKICGSPDNTSNNNVEICYLSANSNGTAIGMGTFDVVDLQKSLDALS